MRFVLALIVVLAAGCSNEKRVQHEALAKTLEHPVSLLCATKSGDAAAEGKAAREAAEALVAIPPFADLVTEGMLVDVRKAARALLKTLGDACKDGDAQQCAEGRKAIGFNIDDVRSTVTRLGGNAETRSGVKMPVPTPDGCAKLPK